MKSGKVYVSCDGGSRGNPGPAAIGIVIYDDKRKIIEQHKEVIGVATNNVAEYKALAKALQLAAKHTKNEVSAYMDSELVVRQMKGLYKVRQENLLKLFTKVKENEKKFAKVSYNHVLRNDLMQQKADELVNDALDGK